MDQITVLLPVHNGANYLQESLSSVLAQEQVSFEVVVLDSGRDGCDAIVAAANDPRVRYVRCSPDQGLFAKLNHGFRITNSPWVRLWAHDDRMLPLSLKALHQFAAQYPEIGMAYCGYRSIDAQGNPLKEDDQLTQFESRCPSLLDPMHAALFFLYFGCLPGNISTVLLRRDAWLATGGFDETFKLAGDFELWVHISERFNVGFLNQRIVEIRAHSQQLSRTGNPTLQNLPEDVRVLARMVPRLLQVMTWEEIVSTWCRVRGWQHVGWIARTLARGQLSAAWNGMRTMHKHGFWRKQLAAWVETLDGARTNTDASFQAYDAVAARLKKL